MVVTKDNYLQLLNEIDRKPLKTDQDRHTLAECQILSLEVKLQRYSQQDLANANFVKKNHGNSPRISAMLSPEEYQRATDILRIKREHVGSLSILERQLIAEILKTKACV